jgi:4-hydroxy-4-methyl-2-oxoglutarate aldolase
MEMQYLLSGITPGHGEQSVWSVNTPVSVAGMSVAPGEIIHMDENGACKFLADKMETVLTNVQEMLKQEADLISQIREAKTGAEIADAMASHSYVNPKQD